MRAKPVHSMCVFAVLLVAACNSRVEKGESPARARGAVSFSQVNEAIFKPSCLGCHGTVQQPNLAGYSQVMAALPAVQRVVMVTKTMPKRAPLSAEKIALLQAWMDQGAPELPGPETGPSVAPRPPVRFRELQDKVVKPRCLTCHYSQNPDHLSNLEDYETLRAIAGPVLFLSVVRPTMPPAPRGTAESEPNPSQLTRSEKEVLSYWVIDGMRP